MIKFVSTCIGNCFNWYFRFAILLDYIFIALVTAGIMYLNNHYMFPLKIDRVMLLNIISNLISTAVSMSGFILAAITIIVSFKANIDFKKVDGKIKDAEDVNNALDLLLFAPNIYKQIVAVFRAALIELTMCFIVLFGAWIVATCINDIRLLCIMVFGMVSIVFPIARSLFVLFSIIKYSQINKE